MLRLLVLRHAKAAPHDEKHDKERPLTERGRSEAALIGTAMRERGFFPQMVLCSPAARTRETWDEVAAQFTARPALQLDQKLYDAPQETILERVRRTPAHAGVLLYIGHNPGLERFARRMLRVPAGGEERRRCERLARDFPTAALAAIDFDIAAWAGVTPGTGALVAFLTPAELRES